MAAVLLLASLREGAAPGAAREVRPAGSSPTTGPWPGASLRALDGDTLALPDGTRLRLAGVDTPERGRPGWAEATSLTRALLSDHAWRWLPATPPTDVYGRRLGRLVNERGEELGAALIERGAGWIYRDDDPRNVALQRAAVDARRGVHGLPMPRPDAPFLLSSRSFHAAWCGLARGRGPALMQAARASDALRSGRAPCRRCLPWPPLDAWPSSGADG